MAESIVINADAFFDRLTHLYNLWKSDKRASDGSFGGADSIVVLAGKAEQESSYQKHNALHVSRKEAITPLRTLCCNTLSGNADGLHSSGCWVTNFQQP
jgi:hypothetical protein